MRVMRAPKNKVRQLKIEGRYMKKVTEENIEKFLVKKKKHLFFNYGNGVNYKLMRDRKIVHINVREWLYRKRYKTLETGELHYKRPACRKPLCVHPEHQKLRTFLHLKLTKEKAKEIRMKWAEHKKREAFYRKNKLTHERLGQQYKVTHQMIERILNGKSWID